MPGPPQARRSSVGRDYHRRMLPRLPMTRPGRSRRDVGSDGLTDDERAALVAEYHATVARKSLKAVEKDVIDRWLASRAAG